MSAQIEFLRRIGPDPHRNGRQTIDMYDENTNYLGSFTGAADGNGVISFLWDLTDGGGNTFNSTNFYGVFTVDTSSLASFSPGGSAQSLSTRFSKFQTSSLTHKTLAHKSGVNGATPDAGSSSASANQLWDKEPVWTPNNNWVVAYGLFSGNSGEVQNDKQMIAGGPGGTWGGALWTLDPDGLIGNLSPGNVPQNETVFTVQDQSSQSNLLSYLADHRYENFYFFGHGNNSTIGSYNGFGLTQDQIAFALVNVPLSYSYPGPMYLDELGFPHDNTVKFNTTDEHAAYHPYRFVYIDACNTGAGNFSEAFAVPAMTSSTNFFAAGGVQSRAFVGFTSWKVNLNVFGGFEGYSFMTGFFLSDWQSGVVNVQSCVSNAVYDAHGTGAHMDSSVVIYGAADMTSATTTRP